MRKQYPAHLVALLLFHPVVSTGGEHPLCSWPFAPHSDASTQTLREIAASCGDKSTSMLFYNRAYHAETMADLRSLSRLEIRSDNDDNVRYHQGRVFIALAEELSRSAWRRGATRAIDDLNAAYDNSIETLEYTIKGYNLLIGRSPGDDVRDETLE